MLTVVLFVIGLIFIVKGGDWFVDASVDLAKILRIPQILIGATIVSIATTLPEVMVSSIAAFQGSTTMSIGNAVGSMICNIGLLVSVVMIFSSIKVDKSYFIPKAIFLMVCTGLVVIFGADYVIGRLEALMLLVMFVAFILYNVNHIVKSKKEVEEDNNEDDIKKVVLSFILGLILIILGSKLLIDNGVILARTIGVSEAVISLSLIAFGTSLPELVTVVTSLKKKNTDIGIGNIIGANVFNSTLVLGTSGIIAPLQVIENNINLDFPFVGALTAILILPLIITGRTSKIQGFTLIALYCSYMVILWTTSLI